MEEVVNVVNRYKVRILIKKNLIKLKKERFKFKYLRGIKVWFLFGG